MRESALQCTVPVIILATTIVLLALLISYVAVNNGNATMLSCLLLLYVSLSTMFLWRLGAAGNNSTELDIRVKHPIFLSSLIQVWILADLKS